MTTPRSITVANWNTEWRKPSSRDASIIRDRLASIEPEIVCLTESHTDFLASWGGHSVWSSDDWGGPTFGTRREIVLWSRKPWTGVDTVCAPGLPKGRIVKATTETELGELTVVGVVIPYHMSNVRHGTRDRRMWDLHRLYLDVLPQVIEPLGFSSIVLGDFNQRLGSIWVPRDLREKLECTFKAFDIVTRGELPPVDAKAIDHIAVGRNLMTQGVGSISNIDGDRQISDHFGVCAELRSRPSS